MIAVCRYLRLVRVIHSVMPPIADDSLAGDGTAGATGLVTARSVPADPVSPRADRPRRTRAPVERVTGGPGRRRAGRARGYRRLRRHRAGPARLSGPSGNPRGQLSRRDAPHPGGPAALPAAVGRLRAGRLHAALLRRLGGGGQRARPVIPAAAAGVVGRLAGLLRDPGTAGPARDGQSRRGAGRRRPAGRDLFRHLHVVRPRPGRLAVPGPERGGPVRRSLGGPHARGDRRGLAARSRVLHEADRAGGRGRGPGGARGRSPPPARRARRDRLRGGRRRQHARARAGQPRLVRVLRLRADEPARAQSQRRQPVLGQ